METFTLFVILPNEEVCSLRSLNSGVTIREVRGRLELMAGLPGQTYRLARSEGQGLHEDHALVLGQSVWDGCVLRVELWDSWCPLYEAVAKADVSWILRNGAVSLKQLEASCDVTEEGDDQTVNARAIVSERGSVALYMAAWAGAVKVCQGLLSVGVDPNGCTPFGRTALFAAAFRNHVTVLETLLTHGAKLSVKDNRGDTPLDIAKRNFSRQVINRIRTFQLTTRGHVSSTNRPTVIRSFTNLPSRALSKRNSDAHSARSVSSAFTRESTHTSEQDAPMTSPFYGLPNRQTPSLSSTPRGSELTPRGHGPFNDGSGGVQFRIAVYSPHPPSANRVNPSQAKAGLPDNQHERASGMVRAHQAVSWSEPLAHHQALQISTPRRRHRLQAYSTNTNFDTSQSDTWYHPGMEDGSFGRPSSLTSHRTGESIVSAPGRPDGSQYDQTVNNVDTRSVDSAPDGGAAEADPNTNRTSPAPRLLRSRQKQSESWRTARRRIQLAEQQKRVTSSKNRETFEQWLDRKRKEDRHHDQDSSMTTTDSEDDENNARAFKEWLQDIRQRPLERNNPKSAAHLHKKKTRAIKGLIQLGDTHDTVVTPSPATVPPAPSTYMDAMAEWKERRKKAALARAKPTNQRSVFNSANQCVVSEGSSHRTSAQSSNQHTAFNPANRRTGSQTSKQPSMEPDEAKRLLETKRQALLATAITYDEWMDHTEEKKQLMKIILEADQEQLDRLEKTRFSTNGTRQISFRQWKESLDEREARQGKLKSRESTANNRTQNNFQQQQQHQQHQQQPPQLQQKENTQRPKSALRRVQDQNDSNNKINTQRSASKNSVAFQAWADNKHKAEMSAINQRLNRERPKALVR